jgi:hypothetical protein
MRSTSDVWWHHAPKRAKRQHAMAIVDYALTSGRVDETDHRELHRAVSMAAARDVAAVVADLPVPRWDLVPVTEPVDQAQRDFAVALLDIAGQVGWVSGADRKWRTMFAVNARTAADLLVLFLDVEPHLRRRSRDPAMVQRLERLAFVPALVQARGRGRLSRAAFDDLVERTASGEHRGPARRVAGPESGRPDESPRRTGPRRHVRPASWRSWWSTCRCPRTNRCVTAGVMPTPTT